MKRTLWNHLAACLAVVALVVASPSALAAKKKKTAPAADAAADKSEKVEKVNLNTADEKEIAAAKGVSDKLAKELVKNRPYKTWDDVSKVKGVGTGKKLDALKKVLKLSGGETAAAKEETPAKETKGKKSKSSSKGEEAATSGGAGSPASTGKTSASADSSSPSKKSSSSSSSEKSAAPKLAPGEKININTASAAELEKLPEIGPVKAAAIVDYRKANGRFASIDDVMKVPGIKEGIFAKIKDSIVVR